jgi:glycosyltransferase involved in cell wall biosynthesis
MVSTSSSRILLDCTSLVTWPFADHLSGIQRTILGLHKGWVTLGEHPTLIRYDSDDKAYVLLDKSILPELIRRNLAETEWVWISKEVSASGLPQVRTQQRPDHSSLLGSRSSLSRRIVRRLLGQGPAATELVASLRQLRFNLGMLRIQFRDWLRERRNPTLPLQSSRQPLHTTEFNLDQQAQHNLPVVIHPGDAIFCLGTELWEMPESITAANALRQQGGLVVRMIYDLIPALKPHWVAEELQLQFTQSAIAAIRQSDTILTISEFSKRELLRFCEREHLDPPPIKPIRLGDSISIHTGHSQAEDVVLPLVPKGNYFLFVSTIDPRKNHRLLYDAWSIMMEADPQNCPELLCIGAINPVSKQLIREITTDPMIDGRIHFLTGINDQALAWYYSHCIATIFPSLYEGWGLPVSEGLSFGKLCLASNASSVPEISPDHCLFFDPRDPYAVARLVRKALDNPSWLRSQEERIARDFQPTSWLTTAKQALAAIDWEANRRPSSYATMRQPGEA